MLDSRSDEYSQNVPCHIICVRDTAFYFECAHMWWCHRILTSNHAYTCNYAFIMVFLFSSVIFWDPSEQRRGPRALPGQIYIYSLRMLSFLLSLPPTTPQPLQFFIFLLFALYLCRQCIYLSFFSGWVDNVCLGATEMKS